MAESCEPLGIDDLGRMPEKVLLQEAKNAERQPFADRLRFESPSGKWEAFQNALKKASIAKPKLRELLTQPGLLG